MFTYLALVSPPVALAIDVFARSLAEIGGADDEHLEALRPGLVASPCTGRDAHRVPFLQLDDLVVELHPPAPAQDHVHLLLLLVRVAVWKAIAGRDALVAQGGSLELERLGRRAELQVRRAVEPRADVLQIVLDVAERERHGAILWRHSGTLAQATVTGSGAVPVVQWSNVDRLVDGKVLPRDQSLRPTASRRMRTSSSRAVTPLQVVPS